LPIASSHSHDPAISHLLLVYTNFMEASNVEQMLSEVLKKNYEVYKDACYEVSSKYLTEAERL